jgi:hypothetical protein
MSLIPINPIEITDIGLDQQDRSGNNLVGTTQETADQLLIGFSALGTCPFRKRVELSMPNIARPPQHDERALPSCPAADLDLDRVRRAVSGIRYGEVRVIIQDGVIVQIERIEKQRLR